MRRDVRTNHHGLDGKCDALACCDDSTRWRWRLETGYTPLYVAVVVSPPPPSRVRARVCECAVTVSRDRVCLCVPEAQAVRYLTCDGVCTVRVCHCVSDSVCVHVSVSHNCAPDLCVYSVL